MNENLKSKEKKNSYQMLRFEITKKTLKSKTRGELGIEPRATPTLRVYHTTRPHAHVGERS